MASQRSAGASHDSADVELERRALQAARVGTWEWDMASGEVRWSDQVAPLFGLAPDDFGGTFEAFLALVHDGDRDAVIRVLDAIGRDGADEYEIEHRVVWPDGSVHWVEGRGRLDRDAAGAPARLAGMVVDATPRKRAEEAVRRTEELFRAIVEDQTEMIVRWLPDGTRTFVNRAYCRTFGKSYDELVGISFYPMVAEPYREAIRQKVAGLTPAAPTATEIHESLLPDGTISWQEWTDRGLFDEAGRLIELQSVGHDVTERIRSEAQLLRANRALRTISYCNQALIRATSEDVLLRDVCQAIIEHGDYRMAWVGFAEHDEDRTISVAGRAGDLGDALGRLRISWGDAPGGRGPTGTAIAESRPMTVRDSEGDPTVARWRDEARSIGIRSAVALPLASGGVAFGALTVYAADPDAFDAEEVRLLGELADDLAFGIGTLRTRREHQLAEESLAASEEKLRQVAENLREAVWMVDLDSQQVLYVSPGYEKIWGRSCQSLYRSRVSWLEGIHPEDRPRVDAARLQPASEYDIEYRVVRPDGTVRWVHDRAFPIQDATGRIYRVAGVADDVTERKRIEEQFRQAQKMEAVGQLAGGVAHDFNNILAAIMLQADEAAGRPGVPGEVVEFLAEIRQATDRAANLTRQLLQFSRQQVMQPSRLDLNEVVTNLARMLQRVVREDVHIQLHLHPSPLFTRSDAGMLEQVLMNLAVNARDAMPDGGVLVVETREVAIGARDAAHQPDTPPGRYVGLRVIDHGDGIPAEHLGRIFEPFFTTKEGHGTGLGLATVFGIVKQHRGAISVTSTVGVGTTFEVLLPIDDSEPLSVGAPAASPVPRGGSETILVVEDDPSLRRLLRRMLARHGYVVLEAASGVEARQVWDQHRASIDLLLTDLVMPDGPNGRDLAAELQARAPGLKVILTSGYSADIAGRSLELGSGQEFLPKPWQPQQLLDVVRRCLDT